MRPRKACATLCIPLLIAWLVLAFEARAAPSDYTKTAVIGEALENGLFDPSVEYGADGSVGWLAYSWVGGGGTPWGPKVETHLATSTDGGATWTFVQTVNASIPDTIALTGGGSATGFWNYEVPSLVYDPGDPGREWKLFNHRIFRAVDPGGGQQNLPEFSWISMRTASDPAGTWSSEVALFGSSFFPPPAFPTQINVNTLDPSLAGLLVYSEPGSLASNGLLYVSLTGLVAAGSDRIVLLVSNDHGATWSYVASPATSADMPPLGYLRLDGSALVQQDGRFFMFATPESSTVTHFGTMIFEFEDLSAGKLRRNGGTLIVHKHLLPQAAILSERGAGQSDFDAHNTGGGIMMPQINLGEAPELFQVFDTHEAILGPAAVPALGGKGWGLLAAAAFLSGLLARRLRADSQRAARAGSSATRVGLNGGRNENGARRITGSGAAARTRP